MKVYIIPEVKQYLNDLITILYEKKYFGFDEYAQKYVNELVDELKTTLPTRLHKPAPIYYDKYGKNMFYALFPKNKRTTWYAFFTKYEDKGETIYLIRYIGNNHTEAHHLYDQN